MARLPVARIERWLWYFFLATMAWQTRIIVWQADVRFIEWHAISLHVSDLVMLGLGVLAVWQYVRRFGMHHNLQGDRIDVALGIFLLAALISISHTDSLAVSLYQFGRLVQYAIFFWYVRYWARGRFGLDTSCLAFVVGALGQSMVGLGQFFLQHDLGLRWIGETLLRPNMPGVAVFYDLAQVKILRAYGTLPHPNVLAVYLALALWAFVYLYLRHSYRLSAISYKLVWTVSGSLLLWALYATFSRTMIVAWMVSVLVFLIVLWHHPRAIQWPNGLIVRQRFREMLISAMIVSLTFCGLFWRQIGARLAVHPQEEAVQFRLYYARQAVSSGDHALLDLNWTGVGIGNFVSWLQRTDPGQPWYLYQPAHNLYLLMYSEVGLIGIFVFMSFLALIIGRFRYAHEDQPIVWAALLAILGSLFFVALFDHFFWTLQQGRILFWLSLALMV